MDLGAEMQGSFPSIHPARAFQHFLSAFPGIIQGSCPQKEGKETEKCKVQMLQSYENNTETHLN